MVQKSCPSWRVVIISLFIEFQNHPLGPGVQDFWTIHYVGSVMASSAVFFNGLQLIPTCDFFWLVVTGTMEFWMTFHIYGWEWNNHPNWLIFFRGVASSKPPTSFRNLWESVFDSLQASAGFPAKRLGEFCRFIWGINLITTQKNMYDSQG